MTGDTADLHLDDTGWLSPAIHYQTHHFDQRPEATDISLLVIHNISLPPGQFGGGYIESFFTGKLSRKDHPYFESICDLRVSAHCLIDRQGKLHQFVPMQGRAWHAGVSQYCGVPRCNDYSIGIELEGADDLAYDKRQYHTLARVSTLLLRQYPQLTKQRIVGHNEIAPGRKTDPGEAFDWQYYRHLISN